MTSCPACGQTVTDASTCEHCGASLALQCSDCGTELRPGARFCDQCGKPQAPPSTTESAERRQLTVMFCDLVGSTELAQRLDAETLREVVRAYQDCAADVIARYEGHIAQYLGDGILAYFGFPQAHENDAERAVRAGWVMPQALRQLNRRLHAENGVELAVRIGLHTGPVVVGDIGEKERRETLALGATIHVAARLEGAAEPGTVLVSEATLRLVDGLFATRDLGTPALKGIDEPIRVFQILGESGAHNRLDVAARLTPLVGRQKELDVLTGSWQRAAAGEGQTLLIIGEPGFGKSRLVKSFENELDDDVHYVVGHGSPFTRASAFAPLIELIERTLRLARKEAVEDKLERLERVLVHAGLEAEESVPLVAALLSLPLGGHYAPLALSSEWQRRQTMEVLLAWILGLAEQEGAVLVVEDLQWLDASTLELIGRLVERGRRTPLLILLTARPEFTPPWPELELEKLILRRLTTDEARSLIAGTSPDRPLPEALVERLVERGDGIPLYLEELTRMLLESGHLRRGHQGWEIDGHLDELAIPTTLQGSLMARLDHLGDAKLIAQIGAVLGRELSYELLAAIAPLSSFELKGALERLVATGLLLQEGEPPRSRYRFKHALLESAAYRSLLRKVRQDLHRRVVERLTSADEPPSAATSEALARHSEGAGLFLAAATHRLSAGVSAAERAATEEAVEHLEHALGLLARLPTDSATLRLELSVQTVLAGAIATQRGYGHPVVRQTLERAHDLFRDMAVGEGPEVLQALCWLWVHHFVRADFKVVAELSPRLLARVDHEGSAYWTAQAYGYVGAFSYFQGDFATARRYLEHALSVDCDNERPLSMRSHQIDPGVFAHAYLGFALLLSGRPDRGRDACHQSLELAERLGHPVSLAFALFMITLYLRVLGDNAEVGPAAEKTMAVAGERGFPFYLAMAQAISGFSPGSQQSDAFEAAQHGITKLEAMGTRVALPGYRHMLAEVCLRTGRLNEAAESLAKAFALSQETGQSYTDAELQRVEAQLLVARGHREAAVERFRDAMATAKRQGALLYQLRAALGLAAMWVEDGETPRARELVAPIYQRFEEGFGAPDLERARALLGE